MICVFKRLAQFLKHPKQSTIPICQSIFVLSWHSSELMYVATLIYSLLLSTLNRAIEKKGPSLSNKENEQTQHHFSSTLPLPQASVTTSTELLQ